MARTHAILTSFVACALVVTAPAPSGALERYEYAALPLGDGGPAEVHHVRIDTTSAGLTYHFTIARGAETETGAVTTTFGGAFVAAWRRTSRGDGAAIETDSLWIDASTLLSLRRRGPGEAVKSIKLPADKPLAVDASALLWMRGFPFDTGAVREVFMADWSRRTVNVDVRERGVETIEVPAGSFECYRMEVVVKVLIFRPRITFWITTAPPHFLVKHRGKRGPFTPTFVTTLTRIEGAE